jgi:hypothetical protein
MRPETERPMPPRWLCLLIVLFWLACNGWLFWRDLLPRVVPGQPPPYTIDVVEEAQTQRRERVQRSAIGWAVYRNDERVLEASLFVEHPDREVFELKADFKPPRGSPPVAVNGILLQRMISTYRVSSRGDLLGIHAHIIALPELPVLGIDTRLVITVAGDVEKGWLRPQRTIKGLGSRAGPFDLPEMAAPRGGSVLLPLHPVKRLRDLRPTQTWQVTLLDPLGHPLALQGFGGEAPLLQARVRAEEEEYTRNRYRAVPCLVIDAEGDGVKVSTWVRRSDGTVLRQDATLGKMRWQLYRD